MDVAFYFVHWFADLAGAEASPLTGCEKFVLKFPLRLGGWNRVGKDRVPKING